MEITIKANPKEIADLVLAIQNRQVFVSKNSFVPKSSLAVNVMNETKTSV